MSYLRNRPTITLSLAMHAAQAALDQAQSESVRISIAVLDASGQLIHMAHMDDAPWQSRDIALNKAHTALGFGVSTTAWEKRLENCSAMVRQGLPLQPGMAFFGGGEPFLEGGVVVGAIGVSGASEAVDTRCAKAAVEVVKRRLEGTQ